VIGTGEVAATVQIGTAEGPVAAPNAQGQLLRRILRSPQAMISLGFLVAVLVASAAATWIAPYGPQSADLLNVLGGPSAQHLLGTDSLGRDVLSRLLYAGVSGLCLPLVAAGVASVIGVPVGLFVGLTGGRADAVAGRLSDIVMAIPGIIVLLMVLSFTPGSLIPAMVALGVLTAPSLMRITRAAAIGIRDEPYIAAARVAGLSESQIAVRHVLPRTAGPIIVNLSLLAAGGLLAETGLNFLGLGENPPAPSWGGMVADGASVVQQQPWLLIPPGVLVGLCVLAFVLLGDAVRDAGAGRWARTGRAARRPRRRPAPAGTPAAAGVPADASPASDFALELRGLTVAVESRARHGQLVPVVQDVSFGIGHGEILGVVGESGCGKTMTALATLGLLPSGAEVVTGDVVINGKLVSAMSRNDRARLRGKVIAYVSQDPMVGLDPLFSIGSQIREAVRRHRKCTRAQARARAIELLEQVRISDPARVARLYPHQVSGGMAQRVSIAIALAGEPAVLIADEPTTALDVTVQAQILGLLQSLCRDQGVALMLISHDWSVVWDVCDRCVVMYAGQVVESGAVADVVTRPAHPYSIGLLAAIPDAASPRGSLLTIPGTVPKPEDWPVSCHFHDRCAHAGEDCRSASIPLIPSGNPDGLARCIRQEHVQLVRKAGAA
jgi:peptide/nickel transport system permease protein